MAKNKDLKLLKTQADSITEKHITDICVLVMGSDFVIKVSPNGISKGLNASTIAKLFAEEHSGKGGGSSCFAQGCAKLERLNRDKLISWLKKLL